MTQKATSEASPVIINAKAKELFVRMFAPSVYYINSFSFNLPNGDELLVPFLKEQSVKDEDYLKLIQQAANSDKEKTVHENMVYRLEDGNLYSINLNYENYAATELYDGNGNIGLFCLDESVKRILEKENFHPFGATIES